MKILIDEEVVKQALDALRSYETYTKGVMIPATRCRGADAIAALRSALQADTKVETQGVPRGG